MHDRDWRSSPSAECGRERCQAIEIRGERNPAVSVAFDQEPVDAVETRCDMEQVVGLNVRVPPASGSRVIRHSVLSILPISPMVFQASTCGRSTVVNTHDRLHR